MKLSSVLCGYSSMYWKSLRECLLSRANHHEFHESVEITDPREGDGSAKSTEVRICV